MAEFTEIMEQTKRLCARYEDCYDCPLYEVGCNHDHEGTNFGEWEKIVINWAKEHEEPKINESF